ncbi:MAG: IS1 family transposase [Rhodothermia bacterium]|nr:IS1 family transposase [Rhodothermia bacterium]
MDKKKAQSLPGIVSTLVPAEKNDVLELDELWSFVCKKVQKRWVWIALCRRTRQVVSFHIGDRSEKTCRAFWNLIPENYRKCRSFSDFWEAYSTVIDTGKHQMVGKESGETAHVERWNNTLVGITRFASEFAASSEKPSRFLRATKCTNFICTCLSTITIHHSLSNITEERNKLRWYS